MGRAPEPGLTCRLAAYLGGIDGRHPASSDPGGAGLLARWADRHLVRCPRCRASEAEWQQLVQLLRTDRPKAPPHLYAQVMARIAAERAVAGPPGARRPAAASRPRQFTGWEGFRGDPLDRSLALGMLVFLLGWYAALAAHPPMLEGIGHFLHGLLRSLAPAKELFGSWALAGQHGLQAAILSLRAAQNLPAWNMTWGFWAAVGVVNTLAIAALSCGGGRVREQQ